MGRAHSEPVASPAAGASGEVVARFSRFLRRRRARARRHRLRSAVFSDRVSPRAARQREDAAPPARPRRDHRRDRLGLPTGCYAGLLPGNHRRGSALPDRQIAIGAAGRRRRPPRSPRRAPGAGPSQRRRSRRRLRGVGLRRKHPRSAWPPPSGAPGSASSWRYTHQTRTPRSDVTAGRRGSSNHKTKGDRVSCFKSKYDSPRRIAIHRRMIFRLVEIEAARGPQKTRRRACLRPGAAGAGAGAVALP